MKNIEIERKYLVIPDLWENFKKPAGHLYIQGYLCSDEIKTVRVRVANDLGTLTIKGKSFDFSRPEFEYVIPVTEAKEMLRLFAGPQIEKIRYKIPIMKHIWEVDEFLGTNTGLILAEIELGQPEEVFELPEWIGAEVTGDKRYYNAYLVANPFIKWKK